MNRPTLSHTPPVPPRSRARRVASALTARKTHVGLALVVAASLLLSGCIVQSNQRSGVLEVNWSANVCEAGSTVRIQASRNGVLESEVSGVVCTRGRQSLFVPPGTYTVNLDVSAADGTNLGGTTITNLQVFANETTATSTLTPGGGGVGTSESEVQVKWTIAGESAATGCAKAGLKTVIVSLLAPTGGKVISTGQTACSDGAINLVGVTPGQYRLQLDGATAQGVLTWGNTEPTPPFNVAPGTSVIIQNPVMLVDLRATVSLNWQFSNGATCQENNVNTVLIEVTDGNNKVIVPMSDPSASKSCDLGPNSPYAQRVIDLQFATPTCTIPPNAKGLVICGITGNAINVSISTVDATDAVIRFGGFMKIWDITPAQHTLISTPLLLAPCSQANPCAAPK